MNVRDWQGRLRGLSARTVDVAVAAVVAAAMTLTIAIAEEPDATRSPGVLAYVLGLLFAALLLARRRYPLLVLTGSVGVLFIYYSLDYPAFSPAVPLAVAAYSAAVAGHSIAAAPLLAGVVIVGAVWQTLGEETSLAEVLRTSTIADAALLAAVLLLGEAIRNRRAWAQESRRRLELAEQDREREAERRVEQERLRIARELHDVIAHTIAAINVQAGVATDSIDEEPGQARASLRTIREQSRGAIGELKAIVGLLRGGPAENAPRAPAPGLDGLDVLVETAGAAGLRVEVTVSGAARALPGSVDLTAYRIVQESLTNVLRHAQASTAIVAVHYDPDEIVIEVEDDGGGRVNGAGKAPGYGLIGMRERVAALGGTLDAGTRAEGGFRVHARLPVSDVLS